VGKGKAAGGNDQKGGAIRVEKGEGNFILQGAICPRENAMSDSLRKTIGDLVRGRVRGAQHGNSSQSLKDSQHEKSPSSSTTIETRERKM